jgi:hypothetical protein
VEETQEVLKLCKKGGGIIMNNQVDKYEVNRKLNSYLVDNGIRKTWLARQTGMSYKKIIDKLSCKSKISILEMKLICDVLNKEIIYFTKMITEKAK